MALLTLCRQGDEVVSSTEICGAINLLDKTFARMGITVRFAEISEPESFARLINDKTRAVLSSLSATQSRYRGYTAIADIAHKSGIPLIVDNTFATPYLLKPIEHGADIVIHPRQNTSRATARLWAARLWTREF